MCAASFRPLSRDEFLAACPVSRETAERFDRYAQLLKKWQAKINLVSDGTLEDMWRRHFLDSAQMAAHIGAAPKRIVDLGSGAGFPGVVLAMLGHDVTLIESDSRKAVFMREVSRETQTPLRVINSRIEAAHVEEPADLITCRAFATITSVLNLSCRFLKEDGRFLLLKGETWESELKNAQEYYHFDYNDYPSETESAARIVELFHVKQA